MKRLRFAVNLILTVYLLTGFLFGQCRNLEELDFVDQVRVTFPASLKYDGVKISTVEMSRKRIRPREFLVDAQTEFPVGFEKDYKNGLWFVFYCADSSAVLWVQRVESGSKMKFETKTEQEKRLKKQ